MFSRRQIADGMAAVHRDEKHFASIWLVCFFSLLAVLVVLMKWSDSLNSPWVDAGFIVMLIAFVGGSVWFVYRYFRNRPARFGLTCTNCRAPLDPMACTIIVNTGYCPYCKTMIVAE